RTLSFFVVRLIGKPVPTFPDALQTIALAKPEPIKHPGERSLSGMFRYGHH
ncbi:MAG: hypothetical protein RL291_2036, partial [Pseudomonadota bacterium]